MILFFGLCFSVKAQQTLFPARRLLFFNANDVAPVHQSMMLSKQTSFQKTLPAISSGSIKDLPFFCAMECNLRKRTNIWIKLRAGDDASYMKMITTSK
ncbi:MAG: hypothetical protein IPH32_07770 [Bacteroidetes bacterium]|nr:hypothetical protein [Bacteroidota bacterium]